MQIHAAARGSRTALAPSPRPQERPEICPALGFRGGAFWFQSVPPSVPPEDGTRAIAEHEPELLGELDVVFGTVSPLALSLSAPVISVIMSLNRDNENKKKQLNLHA